MVPSPFSVRHRGCSRNRPFWFILALIAGLAGGLLPQSGRAQEVITSITGAQLTTIIQSMGYQAELTTDSQGDPKIRSTAEGLKYVILTYGCTESGAEKACNSFQFSTAIAMKTKPAFDTINRWNRDKRFGKAYLDNDRDPVLEWDVDMRGGVTEEYLREIVNRWARVLAEFKTFINK